ncbi:MAG: hypothetical protein IT376_23090 [Polyangiaceae bacterium]|nr:hypothetical protein [Polyangiaceae bacterium]
MLRRLLFVSSVATSLAFVACGGESNSGGGGGGSGGTAGGDGGASIPFSEVQAMYVAASCESARNCFGDAFDLFLAGRDCAEMVTKQVEAGEFPLIEAAIDDGRVTYDGTKVQACLDAVEARGCDGFLQREPAECQAAIDGTVELGGDCTLDAECKGQAFCKATGACPGKCSALQPAGAACGGDDDCMPGLECPSDTRLCGAPAAAGEDCEGNVAPDCGPGLICLGADDEQSTPGKCSTQAAAFVGDVGDPCAFGVDTVCKTQLSCAISFDAGSIGGTCVAKYASGAACKPAFPEACPQGEFCELPTPGAGPPVLDGVCKPLPKAGESCGSLLGPGACEPDHVCVYAQPEDPSGICRAIANNGAPCSVDEQCWSERCVNGACAGDFACQ